MNLRAQQFQPRVGFEDTLGRHGGAEQVQEDDVLLGDVVLLEDLDGLDDGVARAEDGVHEQRLAEGDVLGELGVDNAGVVGLVRLDEDLADPDRPATGPQALERDMKTN